MVADKSHRRRKRKKKKSNLGKLKKEAKLLIIITGLCFVAAIVLSFLTGKVPAVMDSMIQKQVGGAIERQMKGMGVPGGMDIDNLRRRLGR